MTDPYEAAEQAAERNISMMHTDQWCQRTSWVLDHALNTALTKIIIAEGGQTQHSRDVIAAQQLYFARMLMAALQADLTRSDGISYDHLAELLELSTQGPWETPQNLERVIATKDRYFGRTERTMRPAYLTAKSPAYLTERK